MRLEGSWNNFPAFLNFFEAFETFAMVQSLTPFQSQQFRSFSMSLYDLQIDLSPRDPSQRQKLSPFICSKLIFSGNETNCKHYLNKLKHIKKTSNKLSIHQNRKTSPHFLSLYIQREKRNKIQYLKILTRIMFCEWPV